jgi:amino acid adenylation domain-containing protein
LSSEIAVLPRDPGGSVDWPFKPFSEAALDGSIIDRFEAIATGYAARLAVSDENRSLSYSELSCMVDRIAATIARATGDRPGPVAILLRNEARYPAAMLGVLASGRAFVPLNSDHPIERNRMIAACAKAVALISTEALAANADPLFPPDLAIIDIDRLVEDWPSPRPRRPKADDLAYIIYTSGSTGAPKGVYQNHRGVLHDVLQTTQVADLRCEDRLVLFNPPSLKISVRVSLAGLLNGGSVHCLVLGELTASALASKVQALRITVLWLVPRLLAHIAEGLGLSEKLDTVRVVSLGGDRVNWHDVDVFRRVCSPHARLSIRLGATECGGFAEWFVDEQLRSTSHRLPVGKAYPDLKLMIVDDEGRPVVDGQVGEIHVTSRFVALGYWQDPELTARVFATDPTDPGMRTCKTGDLAVRRPDGLIEYIGRKDQQIKLNGQRIELGEVEGALASCRGVRDAAIVVRRDENGVPRLLAAYCELEPEVSGLLPHHLSATLAESLPLFMVPRSITILSALPRLPNFKIDREELRRRDQLVSGRALAAQPNSQGQPHPETQRTPLALSREVLEYHDVGCDYGGPVDHPFEVFPAFALGGSIIDRFEAIVRRFGARLAIQDATVSLTYAELGGWVDRIATVISLAVAGRPGPVAIFLNSDVYFPAAMLGVLAAGRGYVPLDSSHPIARNALIATQSGAAAVVSAGNLAASAANQFPPDLPIVNIENNSPDFGVTSACAPGPDDLACIIYTSGSTGSPKGVHHSHRNILHVVMQRTNALHVNQEDKVALFYPPTSIAGIRAILTALLNGASLHVLPPQALQPAGLVREIRARKITVCFVVPTLFRRIAQAVEPDQRLDTVRVFGVAGERVDWNDFDLFRKLSSPEAFMHVGIGPTEGGGQFCNWFVDDRVRTTSPRLPIGRANPDMRITIVGEDGRPVADGEIGEFVICGRYLAQGYWQDPDLTARKFTVDPTDPVTRIYKTGDWGRQRPDGLFEFVGRKDEQIKLHGNRIEIGEVESALSSCRGVRDAAVVVRRSENGVPQQLSAYCELKPETTGLLPSNLRAMLVERLPRFMVPTSITILNTLPLLSNFKIDREELRRRDQLAREDALADRSVSQAQPHTEIQRTLLALWREVLKRSDIGCDDDFFLFGGDSLSAVDLLHRIEDELEYSLPLNVLIEAPTVRQLEKRLETAPPGPADNMIRINAAGSQHPLFVLGGVHGYCLYLYPVLRSLGPDQPCYGLQPPGMDWTSVGCETLPEMAAHYIGVMKAIQPHGPYRLLGDSFGGRMVYEIALQLQRMEETVEFLGMLDTDPPTCLDDAGANVSQHPLIEFPRPQNSIEAINLRMFEAQWRAGRDYVLDSRVDRHFFRGELTYFLATGEPIAAGHDRRRLWQKFARGGFRLLTRPGLHGWPGQGPQYTAVATLLRACLNGGPLTVSDPAIVFDRTYRIDKRGHRESILSSTGEEYCIDHSALQGYVDTFTIDAKMIRFAGWAVDDCQRQPAQTIAVFLGDRFLGYGASGTPRPDVAQGLPVEYAGFDFKFWRAAVAGATERPRLFVLSSNSRAAELRFGAVQEAMAVRAELADLRAERADLRVKCAELASQLDAMENSTSWRITAPLRYVRRFISRFAAR